MLVTPIHKGWVVWGVRVSRGESHFRDEWEGG